VAERVIHRFGAEKGKPAGPDRATTTVAEDMQFKVSAGGQKVSRAVGVACSSHAFSTDKL
jgi:translation initiation factor 3 subunit G